MKQLYLALSAGLLSWGLTGIVLLLAQRTRRLAEPTNRGMHSVATPVGGGLGLMAATLIIFGVAYSVATPLSRALLAAVSILGFVSWLDDKHGLSPPLRLAAQIATVAGLLWALPEQLRIISAVPLIWERVLLGIAWIWIINLTNFMDGIDGIAGVGAATAGAGYALIADQLTDTAPLIPHAPMLGLLLAGAALGYLYWNWAPARIFMGDVGAIPLGLLIGFFMLDLTLRGQWAAALILPLYFSVDATLTLFERLRKGAKPWQPHREHAYQRAVLAGMSHAQVTSHVAILGCALMALAVLSLRSPLVAFAMALALTLALRFWLFSRQPTKR